MFPYKYYTFQRLKYNKGLISEAGKKKLKQNGIKNNLKKTLKN